ncbi:hypothetical protein [Halocatena salina]|uniref:DUF8108 domain-containing protein n=1 Tax=Halocatena salina TaxID=2934340 RepID=A0A8U0A4H2_9EURY|nr:hypothetical protein [Halocatena salina]UPM42817.1 hypothetical protein MW046_12775 [Halocatena salina]
MSKKSSNVIALADTVSDLMYGIAGWMLVGLGVAGIVGAVGGVTQDPRSIGIAAVVFLLSVCFIVFGTLVNPRFRRRLNRRHSLTRFGRVRSVDRRVLCATEGQSERCVRCRTRMTEGLVRRYREEFVVAGVPVYTRSEGTNHYCPDCATSELTNSTHEREPPSKSVEEQATLSDAETDHSQVRPR